MSTTTQYPNGTALVSDALTVDQIQQAIQQITLAMLGETVSNTSDKVRIKYPTQGAPFQQPSDDICYLSCVPENEPYMEVRDLEVGAGPEPYVTQTFKYTKGWRVYWTLYGPNSEDRARMLKSALYQEYFTDQFAAEQLFPTPDFPEPVRAPEVINGQWFERCDFHCTLYEFVSETVSVQSVLSSEVIIENKDGVVADINVT